MNVKNYNIHISFLIALTMLGNAIISVPFLSAKNSFICMLLSFAVILVSALLFIPIVNKAKGTAFYIMTTIIILISFYGAISTFCDYIKFLDNLGGNKILSSAALLCLVWGLTAYSNSAFLKFSLSLGIVTIAFMLLLFIMPIARYKADTVSLTPIAFDFKKSVLCTVKYFSPVLSAVCYTVLSNNKAKIKNTVFGVLIGGALLLRCLLQSLFMLGSTASSYSYPYLAAVSAYSSGQLYIRQDGFVWVVFFAASVIKISLCTKTIWRIIKTKKTAIK